MHEPGTVVLHGLCEICLHAEHTESKKGSVFILCAKSRSDPDFAKYPRLPVLSCTGFEEVRSPHFEDDPRLKK